MTKPQLKAEFDYSELECQLIGRSLPELDRELLSYQKVATGIFDAHIFVEAQSGKVAHTRILSSTIRDIVRTEPYNFRNYEEKRDINVIYAGRMEASEALAHIMVRKCILDSHHYYERLKTRNRRRGPHMDIIPNEKYL